jgi:flagellar basal body rod protein FlgG
MKSIVDIFSGQVYTETSMMRITEDGRVFTKMGDNYIDPNGDLIIKQGNYLLNTKTGVMSNFGDPFLEAE